MANGLLDFISTPEGQGLLSAAFGGLAGARRGTPLNNIGRAGIAGLTGYGSAQDRITQEAEAAQARELRAMQTAKYKRDMTADETAAAEKQRVEDLIRTTFLPVTGTNANARTGITGPRPEAAEAIGSTPAVDWQQMIAMGVPYARAKEIAEAKNLGRNKVARTAEVEGPDGSKRIVQLDDFGGEIGSLAGYTAPVQVNQGDRVTFAKPVAGQSFGVGMSPSEMDSSRRGWASVETARSGQNMTDARARERLDFDRTVALGGSGDGGAPVKLTESEGKNTLYLSQMRDASNTLAGLEKSSPAMVAATGSPYTNWMAGKNAQKVGQTQRQWAEAYLRAKTGAAATAGEVDNNIRTFFPVVGDDDETISQKADARRQAESDMEIPAGRGADRAVKRKDGAPSGGKKTISMADIQATARASGKTTEEVTAAARARGFEVR